MARDVQIKIGATDAASAAFSKVATKAKQLSTSVDSLGKSMVSSGTSALKFGGIVGGAIIGGLGFLTASASETQETMGKFSVVFSENADTMEAWSNATAEAMGVSRNAMAGMLSGMQDLLVPMGVVPAAAEGMSKTLSALAVDLGSFNNTSSDQVMVDLMAAMTGSGEVMKKYGVILSEASVKQELMNMGIDPKTADDAAKAQARMNIMLRGTTAAQGDAIRTSGSFANQLKALKATGADLASMLGTALVDDLANVVGWLKEGANSIKTFVLENTELVRTAMLAAGVIGGLALAISAGGVIAIAAGAAISGIVTIVGTLATVASAILTPFGLVIGVASVLAAAFVYAAYESGQLINIFDAVMASMKALFSIASTTFSGIKTAITAGNWAAAADIAWAGVKAAFWTGLDGVYGAVTTIIPAIWDGFSSMFSRLINLYSSVFSTIAKAVMNPFDAAASISDFFSSGALDFSSEDGGIAGYLKKQRIASQEELSRLASAVSTQTKAIEVSVGDNAPEIAKTAGEALAKQTPTIDIQADYKLTTDPTAPVTDSESSAEEIISKVTGKPADLQAGETRLLVRGRAENAQTQLFQLLVMIADSLGSITDNTATQSMSGDHDPALQVQVIK